MKRPSGGGGSRPGSERRPSILSALTPRSRTKRMSREEIETRFKALIQGSPEPKKVESPFDKSIYDGEDDE